MATILFVHGTGVREPAFRSGFAEIKRQILKRRSDISVEPCFWGGQFGTSLRAEGASIPGYGSRSLGADEDYEIALWGQLYQEPLYELLLLGTMAAAAPTVPTADMVERLDTLTPSTELQDALVRGDVQSIWDAACEHVARSEALRAASHTSIDFQDELPLVVARAVTAEAMARVQYDNPYALVLGDADLRDEIVLLLASELGMEGRFIGGWIKEQTSGLVKNAASAYLQWKRDDLTDSSVPMAGDILHYLTRGEKIRQFVREKIRSLTPPVVVLAHSLGGIILVDLLVKQPLPAVSCLVTIGSQSPFLYEIDALGSLPYGQPLPDHFPKWVNLYDPNDVMSYVGEGIFPGRVRDVRIESRQPFPRAHSVYWLQKGTWEAVMPLVP